MHIACMYVQRLSFRFNFLTLPIFTGALIYQFKLTLICVYALHFHSVWYFYQAKVQGYIRSLDLSIGLMKIPAFIHI